MNSLGRVDTTYSSSEGSSSSSDSSSDRTSSRSASISSDEQPEWYEKEMTTEERINHAAITTHTNRSELEKEVIALRQQALSHHVELNARNIVIQEKNTTIQGQAQTIQEQMVTIQERDATIEERDATIEELNATIAEQVERIDGFLEDRTAHNNLAAATRSIDWWRLACRAGSIALNVLGIGLAIAAAVLIILL